MLYNLKKRLIYLFFTKKIFSKYKLGINPKILRMLSFQIIIFKLDRSKDTLHDNIYAEQTVN